MAEQLIILDPSAAVQASRSSRIPAAYSRVPKKGSPGRSSTAIEIKYQSTPGLWRLSLSAFGAARR